jgi:hypothetical protein
MVEGKAGAFEEAFMQRSEGRSYGEIAAWINNHSFHTRDCHAFTSHAIKEMLNNHFCCGFIKYLDKDSPGKHEAIITEDLFRKVQARRQNRV